MKFHSKCYYYYYYYYYSILVDTKQWTVEENSNAKLSIIFIKFYFKHKRG